MWLIERKLSVTLRKVCFETRRPRGTCHKRKHPQTLPLLTPSICTVGWFPNWPIRNSSDTLFDQKSPVHALPGPAGGDKQTQRRTLRLVD